MIHVVIHVVTPFAIHVVIDVIHVVIHVIHVMIHVVIQCCDIL